MMILRGDTYYYSMAERAMEIRAFSAFEHLIFSTEIPVILEKQNNM